MGKCDKCGVEFTALCPVCLPVPLTDREQQVLNFMAEGLSSQEMILRLHFSAATIKRTRTSIRRKLGIEHRITMATRVVHRARELGLLTK